MLHFGLKLPAFLVFFSITKNGELVVVEGGFLLETYMAKTIVAGNIFKRLNWS